MDAVLLSKPAGTRRDKANRLEKEDEAGHLAGFKTTRCVRLLQHLPGQEKIQYWWPPPKCVVLTFTLVADA